MDRLDEIIEFCEDQIRYNDTMVDRISGKDIWEDERIKNPDVFALGLHVGQKTILKHLAGMLKKL